MKQAFAVRSHVFGDEERALYEFGEGYFGKENTFLVLHTKESIEVPKKFNKIVFNDHKILNSKELFFPKDVGWRCGDYCYYAMDSVLAGYDFYWLVEPDLKFCNEQPARFFDEFNNVEYDFLAPYLSVASEKLDFYPTAKVLEAPPMSCLFPITRVRVSSVRQLYEIRKKVSQKFINGTVEPTLYPNDEIFVCTVSKRINLRIGALDKFSSFDFSLFRSNKENVYLREDIKDLKANFLIHPVLNKRMFLEKKKATFNNTLRRNDDFSNWVRFTLTKMGDQEVRSEMEEIYIKEFENFVRNRK